MNLARSLMPATAALFIIGCTAYDPGMRDWRGRVEIKKKDSSEETDIDASVIDVSDSGVDDVQKPQMDASNHQANDSSEHDLDTATDEDSSICELDNATATRVAGECIIDSCDDGYGDCDTDDSTGCETQLNDDDHCGACHITCEEVENATASCREGSCFIEYCDQGFADCNEDPRDGCETSLNTPNNCGACDSPCTMPETGSVKCEDGKCVLIECEPGWDSCTRDPNSFCETRIDTLDHCGSCYRRCNENTADHCEEGSCVCGALGRRCAIWECCWIEACWPWPCIPL
jgi:hypothetical protein